MIGEILVVVALLAAGIFAYTKLVAVRIAVYIALVGIAGWVFFRFFVKQYDEFQRAIIFRFGKFNRIAGPGWSIVLPFIEKEYQQIDVRVKMIDVFVPIVFTEDDLRLKVDGTVYYKINDPNKAVLKIDNYMTGMLDLIKSEVRNLMASMKMRDLFSSLDTINDLLADKIRHSLWNWGIDVSMVQIKGIMPSEEIVVAMQEKEIASQFMQAEKFRAEAKKIVMEAIGQGARSLDDRAIMYLYVKALEEMSKGSATKIVLPMQMTNLMNSVGNGVGLGIGFDVSGAVNAIKEKITSG